MCRMIEHMFDSDKFGAESLSAAQDPISQNSLRNVQLTISRTDTSRFPSVPSRTGRAVRRPKPAAMPCSADSQPGAGAGGEAGDAGQRLLEEVPRCHSAQSLEEPGLGDAGPVGLERATLAASCPRVPSMLDAPASSWAEICWSCSGSPGCRWWPCRSSRAVPAGSDSSTFGGKRAQTNVHSPLEGTQPVDGLDPPAAAGQPEQVGGALLGGGLEADQWRWAAGSHQRSSTSQGPAQAVTADQDRPRTRTRLGGEPSRPRPSTRTTAPASSTTSAGAARRRRPPEPGRAPAQGQGTAWDEGMPRGQRAKDPGSASPGPEGPRPERAQAEGVKAGEPGVAGSAGVRAGPVGRVAAAAEAGVWTASGPSRPWMRARARAARWPPRSPHPRTRAGGPGRGRPRRGPASGG